MGGRAALSFVRKLVQAIAGRCPAHVRDDLMGAGLVAYVEAEKRFDLFSAVPFERWVSIRVDGAIRDELRRRGRATLTWSRREGRHEDTRMETYGTPEHERRFAVDGRDDPMADWRRVAAIAERVLSDRERYALMQSMLGSTTDEIAGCLAVSQSRVSQLTHRAIDKIRAALLA